MVQMLAVLILIQSCCDQLFFIFFIDVCFSFSGSVFNLFDRPLFVIFRDDKSEKKKDGGKGAPAASQSKSASLGCAFVFTRLGFSA